MLKWIRLTVPFVRDGNSPGTPTAPMETDLARQTELRGANGRVNNSGGLFETDGKDGEHDVLIWCNV